MARPKKHETFLYRTYKKVRPTQSGCFEFYGHRNEDGYGRIRGDEKKLVFVHREIWRRFRGEIPEKMCICHHCDNPCCVNLNHMFMGTHQENMADRKRKKRYAAHPGSKNGSAVLTEADIPTIRQRIKLGEQCYALGREYGVTGEAILAIKHGRNWKHV